MMRFLLGRPFRITAVIEIIEDLFGLQLESGDYLLLETGDKLLLERRH